MSDEPKEIEKAIFLDKENPILKIDSKIGLPTIETELDEYIYSCSYSLIAIGTAIDKIKISVLALEKVRGLIPKESPFNELEHIEFAIENYFIRSSSLYDRCLIFTGKLLNLGINNESINHNLLVTNEHVIKNGLSKPLKKIGDVCREYLKDRNIIVHHGRYDDKPFQLLLALHKANQLHIENGQEPPTEKELIDSLISQAVSDKLIDLNDHLTQLEEKVNDFYVVAIPVYFELKNKLRKL